MKGRMRAWPPGKSFGPLGPAQAAAVVTVCEGPGSCPEAEPRRLGEQSQNTRLEHTEDTDNKSSQPSCGAGLATHQALPSTFLRHRDFLRKTWVEMLALGKSQRQHGSPRSEEYSPALCTPRQCEPGHAHQA